MSVVASLDPLLADRPATREDGRPWRKYRYPLFKQTFEELPDGRVLVVDDDGKRGLFHWNGPWIEGDITTVNLHMLVWTGGPDTPAEFHYRWTEVPIDINRPSGWPEEYDKFGHLIGQRTDA